MPVSTTISSGDYSSSSPQQQQQQQQQHRQPPRRTPRNTTVSYLLRHPRVSMITLQQYITTWIHQLVRWIQGLYDRWFGQVLVFEDDSGLSVRVGHPMAEGGFSVVLEATDVNNHQNGRAYALKRIRCQDSETVQACRDEAAVHQTLQRGQPHNAKYLMPLYGLTWTTERSHEKLCYMLFPRLPHSLRQEVNRRIFFSTHETQNDLHKAPSPSPQPPWSETSIVLQILQHLLQGVTLMHQAGYSHRDIKLENILCHGSNPQHLTTPVLMDFGSAGPLTRALHTRQDVLDIPELASQHTTISYRPPELFPGELRLGDADLDYAKVDVWSCGCVLFALLYGASPFESEFHRRTGHLRIVDCTQLRVLGEVPKPPASTPPSNWYSLEMVRLIDWMLTKDRHQRPTISQVQARVNGFLHSNTTSRTFTTDVEENLFAMAPASAPFGNRSMTY